jgi:hypothetical protein
MQTICGHAQAATCTWLAATESSWTEPANWSGCAAGNGTPAGTPGPGDGAVFPSGTGKAIILPQFITIAELEMAPGTQLGLEESQTTIRQLTVDSAVSLSGATLSGALPPPGGPQPALLSVQLPLGSTLSLSGANTLRRAAITNAGNATFNGGAGARLDLDLNGLYVNSGTGISTVIGDYVLGYSTSGSISNQGTWIVQGPAQVAIERSGATGGQFSTTGLLEVRAGTFKSVLNSSTGFQNTLSGSFRLLDGTIDAGTTTLGVGTGKSLSGSGTVIGGLSVSSGGVLDPRAADGAANGLLNIVGNVQLNSAEVILDFNGPTPAQHDRLTISGSAQWNRVSPRIRMNDGYAPGIDTTIPFATHASVVAGPPVHNRVLSDYALSLALRVQSTQTALRVVPTLSLADTTLPEGNSATQSMNIAVNLSAPTTEVVSFGYTTFPGTAVSVPVAGSGADFANTLGTVTFAPGELTKQIAVSINGDAEIEADEAFTVVTNDDNFNPPLTNASFGNYRKFSASAEARILDDDGPSGTHYLLIGKSTNLPTPTGQVSFVRRYTTLGVAVDGWATQMQNSFGFIATGFCRAPNGNVLSTRFNDANGAILMSAAGAVLDADFGGLVGADESCAFDQQGNAWLGEAAPAAAATAPLRHIAADGRLLQTLQLPVGERGTDWIELDANQCTLYYTSEDSDVRRYDVCTQQPMTHFVTGLEAPCYALRQLPNHDVMVTCRHRIYRYDASGNLVLEYTKESLGETDTNGLFAIQLDPDGETFWTGGVNSGRVVRARIDNGTVVVSFNTGTGGINGLLVQDEFIAAISPIVFRDGFEP